MEIRSSDRALLKAFLEREALDYVGKGSAFVDYRMEKIEAGLREYEGTADYLTIVSLSNAGLIERSLTITPYPWGEKGTIEIVLCTCGKDNCWGTITYKESIREKR